MFFDSLLGATLERRGWLNNDAVNFLSTASAALFALAIDGGSLAFGADQCPSSVCRNDLNAGPSRQAV